jgi:hypothetical protein
MATPLITLTITENPDGEMLLAVDCPTMDVLEAADLIRDALDQMATRVRARTRVNTG